jgi:hypothetical protein
MKIKANPTTLLGFHFSADTLRDGSPLPPVGEWFRLPESVPIRPCVSGLHASVHPFDAFEFAPGPLLHRVELRGELTPHGDPIDKWAGRERRIIASLDATDLLRAFARHCALDVLRLWRAPQSVRDYLEAGDEAKRDAAWNAASAAASVAAWDAAWDAASAAASAAARAAARDATSPAAWDAARAAAWAAAWDAARAAQRVRFRKMVTSAFRPKF